VRPSLQKAIPGTEVLTVIEGRGEAWFDGEERTVALEPGITIVVPANRVHAFRVVDNQPLVTFGIHTFGKRIVNYVSPPRHDGWENQL